MISERWAQLLGAALVVTLVRGLALFLAAYAATALLKRLSGQVRHLIWLGVIAGVLLVPLAWRMLPAVHAAVRIPLAPAAPHRLPAAAVLSWLLQADGMSLPYLHPHPWLGALSGTVFLGTRFRVSPRLLLEMHLSEELFSFAALDIAAGCAVRLAL
jgi:hypothetical protein